MAFKQVVLSDLSGTELDDTTHARVVVEHPDFREPLEIDISSDEAGKLQDTTLRLVNMTVHLPNAPARRVTVETKTLDKLFPGVNFDDVLGGARKSARDAQPARQRAARGTAAPKTPGVDYASPEHAGKLHRGRITEAEAEYVRSNLDKVNKRLKAEGGRVIDPADPSEIKRYGFK